MCAVLPQVDVSRSRSPQSETRQLDEAEVERVMALTPDADAGADSDRHELTEAMAATGRVF